MDSFKIDSILGSYTASNIPGCAYVLREYYKSGFMSSSLKKISEETLERLKIPFPDFYEFVSRLKRK